MGLLTIAIAVPTLSGTVSAAGTDPCGLDDPVHDPWPYCCPQPFPRQDLGALCIPGPDDRVP